jgi:hypothetical protein
MSFSWLLMQFRGVFENGPCMRLFSTGCRDSGNVLKPMVISLRELKKVSWAESVLRGRCRDVHGSVRHPIILINNVIIKIINRYHKC